MMVIRVQFIIIRHPSNGAPDPFDLSCRFVHSVAVVVIAVVASIAVVVVLVVVINVAVVVIIVVVMLFAVVELIVV